MYSIFLVISCTFHEKVCDFRLMHITPTLCHSTPGWGLRSDIRSEVVGAVLDSFGDVGRFDGLRALKVGYRSCHSQDAVIAAGSQTHAVKRLMHERLALGCEHAVAIERLCVHIRI